MSSVSAHVMRSFDATVIEETRVSKATRRSRSDRDEDTATDDRHEHQPYAAAPPSTIPPRSHPVTVAEPYGST